MAGLFARDLSQPIERWGHKFDSVLEANVAGDLDDIGLGEHWGHHVPSGFPVYYEPDFTIKAEGCMNAECPVCENYEWNGDYLELPRWIEVKPPEMLWAVRDHLGIEQYFKKRYAAKLTSGQLDHITGGELGKVKLLAEASGQSILVVDQMNRERKLSITIAPAGVMLQRDHPAVNYKSFLKECRGYLRELEWADRRRQYELQREAEQRRQDEIAAQRIQALRQAHWNPARYPGTCRVCGRYRTNDYLVYTRINDRVVVMCEEHR